MSVAPSLAPLGRAHVHGPRPGAGRAVDHDAVQVSLGALVSGLLLQLGSPPLEAWPLLFVALAPLLYRLDDKAWSYWALGGSVMGLVYGACLLDGTVKWGLVTAIVFTLTPGLYCGLIFALSGWLSSRVAMGKRVLILPLTWILAAYVMDQIYLPLLFSAPLSLQGGPFIPLLEAFGAVGLEFGLVSTSALVASLLHRIVDHWAVGGFALFISACCLVVLTLGPVAPQGYGSISVVQPDIHWSDYAASGWSLERRTVVEKTLDSLTAKALQEADSTVIWPENGNGLANGQLPRRLRQLRQLLSEGRHDLLAPGREFSDNHEYLSLTHFSSEGVRGRIRKANLVPFAEAGLRAGQAGVLETKAGVLGIAICYDAMFGPHMRALMDQGAQAMVVSTDNSSFGSTKINRMHLAYAVLRAAELGRSLVFAANAGPSALYVPHQRETTVLVEKGRRVARAEVPLNHQTTPADRGGRHLLALAALILLVSLIATRHQATARRPHAPVSAWIIAPAALLIIGVISDGLQRLPAFQNGATGLMADFIKRQSGYAALDAMGPQFVQSQETSCGATALAFVLTRLGDYVYEEDINRALGQPVQTSSLADLGRVAQTRGFEATAVHAQDLEALSLGPGTSAILHLDWDHFIVVMQPEGDEILMLDPMVGRILKIGKDVVEQRWSGYGLLITPKVINL